MLTMKKSKSLLFSSFALCLSGGWIGFGVGEGEGVKVAKRLSAAGGNSTFDVDLLMALASASAAGNSSAVSTFLDKFEFDQTWQQSFVADGFIASAVKRWPEVLEGLSVRRRVFVFSDTQEATMVTVLLLACAKGNTACVKAIIESDKFLPKMFRNDCRELGIEVMITATPLMVATGNGHAEVVTAILNSPKFDADLLRISNMPGCSWPDQVNIIFMAFVRSSIRGHAACVRVIMGCDKFDPSMFRWQPSQWPVWHRMTALMAAAKNGHAETVQAILDSPKFDPDMLHYTMMLAREEGHSDCERAILQRSKIDRAEFFTQAPRNLTGGGIFKV